MENLHKIKNLLVAECRTLVDKLANAQSAEDFMLNLGVVHQLSDTISQLILAQELQEVFVVENESLKTENESVTNQGSVYGKVEENSLTNGLFEQEKNENFDENKNSQSDNEFKTIENSEDNCPKPSEQDTSEDSENYNPSSDDATKSLSETDNAETLANTVEKVDKSDENLENTEKEKKFKLASIKGVSPVQSLFNDEELQNTDKPEPGSLLKSNVSTDYMEAEKPKPEFRLDLNDKIAFSKYLFGGSQVELNDTIDHLNSFKTLDEAKEFLSNIYYQKNWSKSEEYAQRLWSLVENKFL